MATLAGGIKLDTARLDQLTAQLQPRAEKIIGGAAYAVEGSAKTRAPVDTGYLKSSISAERQGALLWYVWVYAEYALWIEVGHHTSSGTFVAPQPYLIPALEAVYPQFVRNWRELFA